MNLFEMGIIRLKKLYVKINGFEKWRLFSSYEDITR